MIGHKKADLKSILILLLIASILVVLSFVTQTIQNRSIQKAIAAQPESNCTKELWLHIHNPSRLKIIDDCVTVSGTIISERAVPDGDYHIQLRLDSRYEWMLNAKNNQSSGGNLIAEPICVSSINLLPTAILSCENFSYHLDIPPVGTHVFVTGSYVTDLEHGWNEIHPISKIEVG